MRLICNTVNTCVALFIAISRGCSYYGGPGFTCRKCGAFYWFREGSTRHRDADPRRPVYTGCYRNRKVSLPTFRDWPRPLKDLLRFNGGPVCSRFLRLIRHYNYMFFFMSLGARIDNSVNVGGGPYVFKMNGVVYHHVGPLLPHGDQRHKFAQLYMVDSANKVKHRIDVFDREEDGSLEPDPEIVANLIEMLNRHHCLVHKYRITRQSLCSTDAPAVSIRFLGDDGGSHGTRFSGPTASEVAAVIVGELTPECGMFDIVVETYGGVLQHVSFS